MPYIDTKAMREAFRRMQRRAGFFFARAGKLWRRLRLPGKLAVGGGAVLILGLLITLPLLLQGEKGAVPADTATYDMDIRMLESPQEKRARAGQNLPAEPSEPRATEDPGFRRGVENEIVQVIQERLMELGFLEIDESTQKYGPQTEAAVKLFQR